MGTITYTGTLVVLSCADCSMDFAMPEDFKKARRDDHCTFYCPKGHKNYYPGESDEEKLTKRAERAEVDAEIARSEAEFQRRSAAAIKGHQTRLKKRIANGVCPCCNRTFKDLARHMNGQHPDYTEGE